MTLSLVAVFIPVMFMGGIIGRLLHEFAVTIAAAILISGFVSLTLTPMLASRYLCQEKSTRHGKLYWLFENAFNRLLGGYRVSLAWSLAHPRLVLATFFLSIAGSVALYQDIPKDFLPSGDSGRIMGRTEGAPDTSFASMVERQRAVAAIAASDPNIEILMSVVGSGGSRITPNSGILLLRLKPGAERKMTPDEIIQKLRPKLAAV
ncbi:MAG: efflux RND transporter permease subunit, partial [Pseudomonadota bacterium]|nr:efflux RND transporter permease subunit [Pseudomonadota bacterium]